MLEFLTAFLHEATGQPFATFLSLVILAGAIWWFVRERPAQMKDRKAAMDQQHEDSLAIASHIGCANEVIRHSAAVIENSTKVIENNTKVQELLESSVQTLQDNVGAVRDDLAVNRNMLTEVLAIVRQK
jgi:hypothetical protein